MIYLIIAEAVILLLLAIVVFALLRTHADILRALNEIGIQIQSTEKRNRGNLNLKIHQEIASASNYTISSKIIPDEVISRFQHISSETETVLLAFLSSGCSTCHLFFESFRNTEPFKNFGIVTYVVTKGPEFESPGRISKIYDNAKLFMDTGLFDFFGVQKTPHFVLLNLATKQIVGAGSTTSPERLYQMIQDYYLDTEVSASKSSKLFRESKKIREAEIDQTLKSAGIKPGDPSLYGIKKYD